MINIVYYKKLKKIIKQVKKCNKHKKSRKYNKMLWKQIARRNRNDKYKFLQYNMEVETELDLNFSAFLVSIIALITTCILEYYQ